MKSQSLVAALVLFVAVALPLAASADPPGQPTAAPTSAAQRAAARGNEDWKFDGSLPDSDFVASREAFVGIWDADFEAMLTTEDMSDEQRALAASIPRDAQMRVTFGADGSFTMEGRMSGQDLRATGTWTLDSVEGNRATFSTATVVSDGRPFADSLEGAFASRDAVVIGKRTQEGTLNLVPFGRADVEGDLLGGANAAAAPAPTDGAAAVNGLPPAADPHWDASAGMCRNWVFDGSLPESDFVASREALVGDWDADFQAELAAMSDEARAIATSMLGSAALRLTFRADGTMRMDGVRMGQAQTQTGTWELVSTDTNRLAISVTTTYGTEPYTQTMTVGFFNASAYAITNDEPGSVPIPFYRLGPPPAALLPAPVALTEPAASGTVDPTSSPADDDDERPHRRTTRRRR
ncbi:MAG: hypothetical protein H6699_08205 [Myxococcales bacterium]|nr:hypothetical protein [Myxococcales bacterium]